MPPAAERTPAIAALRGAKYLRQHGLRMVTWNCNGYFLHSRSLPSRQSAKHRILQQLLDSSDVLALQETHGDAAHLYELQKHLPFHALYGSFCEHRGQGGVVLAIRRTLLARCTTVTAHQLEPGRVLRLLLDGPSVALNLVSVHIDTSLPQNLQHNLLRRLLQVRDLTLDFTTLLAGDFNFTFPGDSRLRLCDTRYIPSDDPLGSWFVEHSDPFKAIHYDGYSRVGYNLLENGDRVPAILSAIDHVMTDLPPAELQDLRPLSAIRCNPLDFRHSDHAPVILLLRPMEPAVEKAQTWPSWLYATPEYTDFIKRLSACTLTRTPSLREAKQFLTDSLDEILLKVSARPAATTSEHLYWATRALRLSRLEAAKGLRLCLDASPPLRDHFHRHDPPCL